MADTLPIPLTAEDELAVATTVAHVQAFVGVLEVKRLFEEASLHDILTEAFIAASGEYDIRAAQAWAEGYNFLPQLLQRDEDAFTTAGDIEAFSRQRQQLLDHERINLGRVHGCFGTDGTKVPGLPALTILAALKTSKLLLPSWFSALVPRYFSVLFPGFLSPILRIFPDFPVLVPWESVPGSCEFDTVFLMRCTVTS
jgi:hypothetical protein